jgi:hypothetical protein
MELPKAEGGRKPGRKPGQRRRTPLEIARDRAYINKLRLLHRKSISEISILVSAQYADEIADPDTGLDRDGKLPPHIGVKQVRKELDGAIQDYKELMADEITAKRLEAIRRYESLAALAIEEYEKSATDKLTKTSETTTHPEYGEITKDREVVESKYVGDPRYLSIHATCVDRIAELEAIVPPKKTALTNPEGTEPFKFEGAEELRRLNALAEELLNPSSKNNLPEVTP